MPDSALKKYTLTGGENTYASPAATDSADARKLQSLIPSLAGSLERERPAIPFTADAAFPSRVAFFHQFKRNNSGVFTSYFFCATATTLYKLSGFPGGTWQPVTQVGTLGGFPVAVNIDNTMQLDDAAGGKSWLFDGTNWVRTGLPIPLHTPTAIPIAPPAAANITSISRSNNVVTATLSSIAGLSAGMNIAIAGVADASFNINAQLLSVTGVGNTVTWAQFGLPNASSTGGTVSVPPITIVSNRYWWTTFVDATTGRRQHESSSSPTSVGSGASSGKIFRVQQRYGTIASPDGINFTGTGTDFGQDDVGMVLYAGSPGNSVSTGVIKTVTDATHLVVDNTATPFQPHAVSGDTFVIAPVRATHWQVYASSSEEDKLGNLLGILIPLVVTQFIDDSPMVGTTGSDFTSINRPFYNDPPPPSPILEVHKNRLWRTLTNAQPTPFPNFYAFTGFEEVQAEQAGSPYESSPGVDPHTVSPDIVDEDSYPDQSSRITAMKHHGDALYIGTDLNVIPLYGSNITTDIFSLSENQAFGVGFAGRKFVVSTPFGLMFLSYDLKVYLYPSQYSWGVDTTTALVELSRPKRNEFELIDGTDFDNGSLVFYNWGRRNWAVLSYRRNDLSFATWVFDFETKGWFQLQQGYTQVFVFEMTPGKKTLVGAGTDNKVYVIDDRTGNFPVTNQTYPVGTFRQLVDFGEPNSDFVLKPIEYEVSNAAMKVNVSVWLDPDDPDNPTTPKIPIVMTKRTIGRNRFSGLLNASTGATCQRALVEFSVPASTVNGRLNGFSIFGDKIKDPTL